MVKTTWQYVGVVVVCVAAFGVERGCVAQNVPATPTTAPATAAPSAEAMELLKALEAAGDKFTAIRADIDYTVFNPTLGDKEIRTGDVLYAAAKGDTPARFRIHFKTRQDGDKATILPDQMEYAFDGSWFYIKDHNNKTIQQIQVAAPGEKVEPLRLGKGPFPLPFGQKVDDVLEFFHPVTRDHDPKTDPPNTRYLKLTPKPGKADQVNFIEVEQWVDKDTNLPVKLIAKEKNKTTSTVLFGKREGDKVIMDTKPTIKDDGSDFRFEVTRGWKLEMTRLDEKK